jgi:hypothetical protein
VRSRPGLRGRVTVVVVAVVGGWVAARTPAGAWPRSTVDGDEVRGTVDRVLRDPAFTASRENWLSRLRDDVRQWILERLADVFESGAGTVLAWGLVALAVLVGVLVLVRATRGLRRGAVAPGGPAAVVVTRRPATEWLDDARAARSAGDLAEAVRCGYRAVVAGLARRGAVEEVPGRTVGEYRAQVARSRPDEAADFGRASEVFERVWYARRDASPDDVDVVLGVAEATAGGPRTPTGAGA